MVFTNKKGKSNKQNYEIKIDGSSVIHDSQFVATHFNEYFVSVGSRLSDNIPASNKSPLDFIGPPLIYG